MRRLELQAPRGKGDTLLRLARKHGAVNVSLTEARDDEGAHDLVVVHVPNRRVGGFVDAAEDAVDGLRLTLEPRGVLPLYPPAHEAPDQVREVQLKSPLEVYLAGLQSVGSWQGLLGYAFAAGAVVWVGLYTETSYLLVAAMLIAPFAGPAMNAAIATARGDWPLLRRSLLRYVAALAATILMAALLSLVMRQRIASRLMLDVSDLSTVAFVLPLVAGAAGALNLVQSERSSLVSGAAVGMLVAASLAPPAGIVGMAAVLREWSLVKSGLYLLALQLAGINLSGAIVFRLVGLRAKGPRFERGRSAVVPVVLAVSALVLGGLVAYQGHEEPELQRSSLAQRAVAEARAAIGDTGVAYAVNVEALYTRADVPGQETLLVLAHVQKADPSLKDGEVAERVRAAISERLQDPRFGATPLVDVTVLQPLGGG